MNRSESTDLATVSCSKPAVKVWMRWPPSGLSPRLGVRDFIDVRENRLSLGLVGPWKLCSIAEAWALTSTVIAHNPLQLLGPQSCPLQDKQVYFCNQRPLLRYTGSCTGGCSPGAPCPHLFPIQGSRAMLTMNCCQVSQGPQRIPSTPPPHQRVWVMQPACNFYLTPQAWLLRTEKESPSPTHAPSSGVEGTGAPEPRDTLQAERGRGI